MLGLNINGNKTILELLFELFSANRRKQGEEKRKLEIAQQRAAIQSENAKTQHEIASANLENAQARLFCAQAMKTRAEAYGLMFEILEKSVFDFGLSEEWNNKPCFEHKVNTFIEDILNRD